MSEQEPPAGGGPARRARLRRAPRYGAFAGTGLVLGLLVALLLTFTEPAGRYSYGAVLGYLAVTLGALGALVGALVAVLVAIRLDRRQR